MDPWAAVCIASRHFSHSPDFTDWEFANVTSRDTEFNQERRRLFRILSPFLCQCLISFFVDFQLCALMGRAAGHMSSPWCQMPPCGQARCWMLLPTAKKSLKSGCSRSARSPWLQRPRWIHVSLSCCHTHRVHASLAGFLSPCFYVYFEGLNWQGRLKTPI